MDFNTISRTEFEQLKYEVRNSTQKTTTIDNVKIGNFTSTLLQSQVDTLTIVVGNNSSSIGNIESWMDSTSTRISDIESWMDSTSTRISDIESWMDSTSSQFADIPYLDSSASMLSIINKINDIITILR